MRYIKFSLPLILISFVGIVTYIAFSVKNNPTLQFECNYITFDDSIYSQCIVIDTINDKNNIWQIGRPNKNIFKAAHSNPNVIVTDTVNPYPSGDTSKFYIDYLINYWGIFMSVGGYYRINTDTLTDYGKIEISPDNGITWIDAIHDSLYSGYIDWYPEKPVLTGNSGGWKYFEFNAYSLLALFNVADSDTVLFRFTFISDTIDNNRDGIMFDDINITTGIEGIDEKSYNFVLSKVFPSFSKEYLDIHIMNEGNISFQLYIFDQAGRSVMEQNLPVNNVQINIEVLHSGIYYYELVNHAQKKYSSGKFIK